MPTTTLVMVDGLRPDALAAANLPHIERLRARSAYTLSACSVEPSLTLPCHMSIFHSVPPARHGVMTNHWQPMARPIPGLMEQARAADRRCYFFHNWEPLRDLSWPESLSFVYYRDNCYTPDGDVALIVCGDDAFPPKPIPADLRWLAMKLDIRSEHLAMVGDSANDILAGRNAGAGACIGVAGGAGKRHTLARYADVILDGVGEIEVIEL